MIRAMKLECLDRWPQDPAAQSRLRDEWQALLQRAAGSIFSSHDWLQAWWQTFGTDRELALLLVRDAALQLQGIAPLMFVRGRSLVRGRRLMLLGTDNTAADYADFIVADGQPAAHRAILDWIVAQRRRWTSLELLNLPEHSPTLALSSLPQDLQRPFLQFAAEAPARVLGDADADRRMLAKKSLRRHVNGFSREGQLEYRRLTSATEIEAHLGLFFDQHRRRWAGTGNPSLFEDPAQRAFYRALAARLDPGQSLHFVVVLFDQRPIAYHFGFELDGVFTWYKPSFEPDLQQRSPGEVLIRFLLEDAVARGLREFDFTIGSEAFKFRFATVVRRVYRLRVYRRTWERIPVQCRELLKQMLGGLRLRVQLMRSRNAGPSVVEGHPARSA